MGAGNIDKVVDVAVAGHLLDRADTERVNIAVSDQPVGCRKEERDLDPLKPAGTVPAGAGKGGAVGGLPVLREAGEGPAGLSSASPPGIVPGLRMEPFDLIPGRYAADADLLRGTGAPKRRSPLGVVHLDAYPPGKPDQFSGGIPGGHLQSDAPGTVTGGSPCAGPESRVKVIAGEGAVDIKEKVGHRLFFGG